MAEKEVGGGFAIGFVLGALVGLTIGFLYAPRPGQETRELLREKAKEVRDKTAEAVDKVKEATGSRLLGIPDYSSSGEL